MCFLGVITELRVRFEHWSKYWPTAGIAVFSVGVLVATAGILLWMGRVPICECGYVKLWHGAIDGQNSQHIFDWYAPSHVLHGFIFFGVLSAVFPRAPVPAKIGMAIVPEAAWEIIENTPMVIEHYREAAGALGYYGDSVINSISDIVAMVIGAFTASRIPKWATLALFLLLELMTLYAVRDGLILNIWNLTFPVDAIQEWQAAR